MLMATIFERKTRSRLDELDDEWMKGRMWKEEGGGVLFTTKKKLAVGRGPSRSPDLVER
jgi:hypothetical protein